MKRIIAVFLMLVLAFPCLPNVFAAAGQAESKSPIEEEMIRFAQELLDLSQFSFRYFDRENVTFRNVVYSVYGGNNNEKPSGILNGTLRLLVNKMLDIETNPSNLVVHTEKNYNEIVLYVSLLQDLLEYEQMNIQTECEKALKAYKSNSLSKNGWNALSDMAKLLYSKSGGSEAAADTSSAAIYKSSVLKNAGEALRAYFGKEIKAVVDLVESLTSKTEHFQFVVSSIDFLNQVADSAPNKNLRAAAKAMAECYTSWKNQLNNIKYSSLDPQGLVDGTAYAGLMKDWVNKSLDEYLEKHYAHKGFREFQQKLRDSVLKDWDIAVTVVTDVTNVAYNSNGLAERFLEMRSFSDIAEAVKTIADSTLAKQKSWEDYVRYAQSYCTYLKVCISGNLALYNMMTEESLLSLQIVPVKDDDYNAWISKELQLLSDAYTNTQDYINRLYVHYTDILSDEEYEGTLGTRTDVRRRTITGTLTHDAYFAQADAPAADLSCQDPDAGKAADGVSVRLVGKVTRREYDETYTDWQGKYRLDYILEAVGGEPLELVIGEECKGERFAVKHVDVWREEKLPFRSDLTSGLAAASPNSDETSLSCTVEYCDQLFLQDPTVYHQELARLSLGMAAAGYSAPEADRYWNQDGSVGRENNIRDAYEKLGFPASSVKTVHYDVNLNDDSGKVAFSMASKEIVNPALSRLTNESQTEHLVAVVLRGGGYGCEWSNNFNVLSSLDAMRMRQRKQMNLPIYHSGFYSAAQDVAREIRQYVQQVGSDGRPVRLWITGYSRSAATANLAVGLLQDLDIQALYAYTFATPSGTTQPMNIPGLYNIVYQEDLVPRVAPAAWGFGKNGTTLIFSVAGSKLSKDSAEKINGTFQGLVKHSGATYNPLDYAASSSLIDSAVNVLTSMPQPVDYAETLQPVVLAVTKMLFSRRYDPAASSMRNTNTADMEYRNGLITEKIAEKVEGYDQFIKNLRGGLVEEINFSQIRDKIDKASEGVVKASYMNTLTNAVESFTTGLLKDPLVQGLYTSADSREWVIAALNVSVYAQLYGIQSPYLEELFSMSQETVNLFTVLAAVWELANTFDQGNTSFSGVGMGHRPEVYMSWLFTLSGKEMFGLRDELRIDVPVLKTKLSSVCGIVFDEKTFQGIPDATVSLRTHGTGEELMLQTDAYGYWEYQCEPDTLEIMAEKWGYEPQSASFALQAGDSVVMNLYLSAAQMPAESSAVYGNLPVNISTTGQLDYQYQDFLSCGIGDRLYFYFQSDSGASHYLCSVDKDGTDFQIHRKESGRTVEFRELNDDHNGGLLYHVREQLDDGQLRCNVDRMDIASGTHETLYALAPDRDVDRMLWIDGSLYLIECAPRRRNSGGAPVYGDYALIKITMEDRQVHTLLTGSSFRDCCLMGVWNGQIYLYIADSRGLYIGRFNEQAMNEEEACFQRVLLAQDANGEAGILKDAYGIMFADDGFYVAVQQESATNRSGPHGFVFFCYDDIQESSSSSSGWQWIPRTIVEQVNSSSQHDRMTLDFADRLLANAKLQFIYEGKYFAYVYFTAYYEDMYFFFRSESPDYTHAVDILRTGNGMPKRICIHDGKLYFITCRIMDHDTESGFASSFSLDLN